MKKAVFIISTVIILGAAYWVLATSLRIKNFDENFPGLRETLGKMTSEEQQELIEQMKESKDVIVRELENS